MPLHHAPAERAGVSGAAFGHIRRKYTLPIGLPVEVDAEAGTLRLLHRAVV